MNGKPDYVVKTEYGRYEVEVTEDTPTKTVTVTRQFYEQRTPAKRKRSKWWPTISIFKTRNQPVLHQSQNSLAQLVEPENGKGLQEHGSGDEG